MTEPATVTRVPAPPAFSPDHPLVRELWRTANDAFVVIADAIEDAGRAGVPPEVIATTTSVPVREVEAILRDAEDGEVRYA